ncbi:phBC6A51 family helix-turn-helix protein [Peribacillus saganii]|nr:phBC6A51 family helix-turn-helix protein [Peribacillus saganii]
MSENIDIDAQRGTKLGLTGKQIDIARILADPTETRTIKAICDDQGVPRRTFYNWYSKPEYKKYVDSLIDKYTDAELGGIWKALTRKAHSGDMAAIKLFMEMKGKYKEIKEIKHNFENLTDEQLDNRLQELMKKVGDNSSIQIDIK